MDTPRLYNDLSSWWPVLSSPADYVEEAEFFTRLLREQCAAPPSEVLELGCGGGNNAVHMKADFDLTLTDVAPGMLEVSRKLNPECEHVLGDMRTLRLNRTFDAVFVHDAVSYMRTEPDLRRALETAWIHCAPGGVAVFAPDHLAETFREDTKHGGHDSPGRSLRYLEWNWDPDPEDGSYLCQFAYILREGKSVRIEEDLHIFGLFSRKTWLHLLREVGFRPDIVAFPHSELEQPWEIFIGRRPLT